MKKLLFCSGMQMPSAAAADQLSTQTHVTAR